MSNENSVGISQALDDWQNQIKEEQEARGFYYWRGCQIQFGSNPESYSLFLKILRGQDSADIGIKNYLLSLRQLVTNQDGSELIGIIFEVSQEGANDPGKSYSRLNCVELKTSTLFTDNQSELLESPSENNLGWAGTVMWGSSGLFAYQTQLYCPSQDLERWKKDMGRILSSKETTRQLRARIPIPGTNYYYEFYYFHRNY